MSRETLRPVNKHVVDSPRDDMETTSLGTVPEKRFASTFRSPKFFSLPISLGRVPPMEVLTMARY